MRDLLQKTILIMSFSTFYVVINANNEWERIVVHIIGYAVLCVLFLNLESKYCGRFLSTEESKKEAELIKHLKMRRTFYGGAIMTFFISNTVDKVLVLSMATMMLIYFGTLVLYTVVVFNKVRRFENEQINEIKEEITERQKQKEMVVFKHESSLEEKKNEVFEWLEKASDKINNSNEFASIENKILFAEAYREGIEKKLTILENMSAEQRQKETERVVEYLNKVLMETKKFVG